MNARKVYVDVLVEFDRDRGMIPLRVRWEDGREFAVSRILDRRMAPALIAGGLGDRYTVSIGGKSAFLFYEHESMQHEMRQGRWFVERK